MGKLPVFCPTGSDMPNENIWGNLMYQFSCIQFYVTFTSGKLQHKFICESGDGSQDFKCLLYGRVHQVFEGEY